MDYHDTYAVDQLDVPYMKDLPFNKSEIWNFEFLEFQNLEIIPQTLKLPNFEIWNLAVFNGMLEFGNY